MEKSDECFQRGKWVISKKVNIDFDKLKFENGNIEFNINFFNIDSKTGSNRGSNGVLRGVGEWGVTADDDRGCYDPVWPRFTVDVKKVDVKFDVTSL